jgi:hypothetical protein
MRIPYGGIKRVGGKIQKPPVAHAQHPLQIYRFGADVTGEQLRATVAAAASNAAKMRKSLKRRGAVSVSTGYLFDRAAAKIITTDDLPSEIDSWLVETDSLNGDPLGEVQESWGFSRTTTNGICAVVTLSFNRGFWLKPMGPDHYIDLALSSIDRRTRTHADVRLDALNPDQINLFPQGSAAADDPINSIRLRIEIPDKNLFAAAEKAHKVKVELTEAAERLSASFASEVNKAKARLSGWGDQPLDKLVSEIDQQKSADLKGRVLEELVTRLLHDVPGYTVNGRTRTLTEEIDIVVVNNSGNPLWKRDGPLVICECKNWSAKCGKDEFVLFREKLKNRRSRCTLGMLVSWNGFAETVTKEELRGSREDLLILPITGQDLREAAFTGRFEPVMERVWQAVATR